MKKVLIVTYYFPPSGGPGVQRVLKFVKYLPEFGWQPVVLTVQDADFPARDESLLAEIPGHAAVYRTKIFEPYRLYRKLTGKPSDAPVDVENIPQPGRKKSLSESLAEFVRATFFIPDARIGWYPYALPAGRTIIHRENIDALYSSSPPYTTAVIARQLHRETRIPWVAGFRDPWTGFLSTPDRWFLPRSLDRRLERSVFEQASAIEAAWKGILTDMTNKIPGLDRKKLVHLPNGFDRDDYPKLEAVRNQRFTVTYTGSMYGKRNPKTFLTAVEELASEGKIAVDKIKLKFIGRFGSEVLEMLRSSPVRDAIEIVPYLPHSESVKELLRADALLLVVDEAAGSEGIVPGKVFEYIGARRPIIALAPEGAVAELMRETRSGYVAANQDIPAIKAVFIECYQNFLYDRSQGRQDAEAVKQYDRREITRQLATLLDNLHLQY
ncbi:MAG: glycosyltransferase family 4 protein [Ignavibacteria bacterium]|nr:glycosyltransferase family 4 protein [Ignavibacteria bacterium]